MTSWPNEVGLIYARPLGKTFRQAHSGVARGLAVGLQDINVEHVKLIDCVAPAWADSALSAIRRVEQRLPGAPPLSSVGAGQIARWRSRRLAPVSPMITLTSRVGALGPRPLVTFEDMTAALARRHPGMFGQTDQELERVQTRQAKMYRSAVACCVGSDWAAASVTTDYGVAEQHVHVVGRGHSFVSQEVDRAWGIPKFLFMSRDWQRKNGERVVTAFRRVRATHPEAQLRLVGSHPAVQEPGVSDEGYLDLTTEAERLRLVQIFKESTCLVMPSLLEPFGLSYLEAGSFGLPSIGTTIGGASEAVGPGGLVVDPYEVRDLEDAMLRLSNPLTAHEMGARALTHSQRYAWPRIAERILSAYEDSR